jgi:hypothetical protein
MFDAPALCGAYKNIVVIAPNNEVIATFGSGSHVLSV